MSVSNLGGSAYEGQSSYPDINNGAANAAATGGSNSGDVSGSSSSSGTSSGSSSSSSSSSSGSSSSESTSSQNGASDTSTSSNNTALDQMKSQIDANSENQAASKSKASLAISAALESLSKSMESSSSKTKSFKNGKFENPNSLFKEAKLDGVSKSIKEGLSEGLPVSSVLKNSVSDLFNSNLSSLTSDLDETAGFLSGVGGRFVDNLKGKITGLLMSKIYIPDQVFYAGLLAISPIKSNIRYKNDYVRNLCFKHDLSISLKFINEKIGVRYTVENNKGKQEAIKAAKLGSWHVASYIMKELTKEINELKSCFPLPDSYIRKDEEGRRKELQNYINTLTKRIESGDFDGDSTKKYKAYEEVDYYKNELNKLNIFKEDEYMKDSSYNKVKSLIDKGKRQVHEIFKHIIVYSYSNLTLLDIKNIVSENNIHVSALGTKDKEFGKGCLISSGDLNVLAPFYKPPKTKSLSRELEDIPSTELVPHDKIEIKYINPRNIYCKEIYVYLQSSGIHSSNWRMYNEPYRERMTYPVYDTLISSLDEAMKGFTKVGIAKKFIDVLNAVESAYYDYAKSVESYLFEPANQKFLSYNRLAPIPDLTDEDYETTTKRSDSMIDAESSRVIKPNQDPDTGKLTGKPADGTSPSTGSTTQTVISTNELNTSKPMANPNNPNKTIYPPKAEPVNDSVIIKQEQKPADIDTNILVTRRVYYDESGSKTYLKIYGNKNIDPYDKDKEGYGVYGYVSDAEKSEAINSNNTGTYSIDNPYGYPVNDNRNKAPIIGWDITGKPCFGIRQDENQPATFGKDANGYDIYGYPSDEEVKNAINSGRTGPGYPVSDDGYINPIIGYDEEGKAVYGQCIFYPENKQPITADRDGKPVFGYTDDNKPIVGYDSHGNPITGNNSEYSTIETINGEVIMGYDADGKKIIKIDENGKPITGYREDGAPIYGAQILIPLGKDSNGNMIITYDTFFNPVYGFDDENNPIISIESDGTYKTSKASVLRPIGRTKEGYPIYYYNDNAIPIIGFDKNKTPIIGYDANLNPITGYNQDNTPRYGDKLIYSVNKVVISDIFVSVTKKDATFLGFEREDDSSNWDYDLSNPSVFRRLEENIIKAVNNNELIRSVWKVVYNPHDVDYIDPLDDEEEMKDLKNL